MYLITERCLQYLYLPQVPLWMGSNTQWTKNIATSAQFASLRYDQKMQNIVDETPNPGLFRDSLFNWFKMVFEHF